LNPRPSVVLLAYHFYPSNEIGARRVTALARYLAARGIGVEVICLAGKGVEAARQLHPLIAIHGVEEPSRWLLNWAVAVKQFLRRMLMPAKSPAEGASLVEQAPTPASSTDAPRGKLWTLFWATVHFIDAHKRWSSRAAREATRVGRNACAIIASGPPNSILIAGARAGRALEVPFIFDLRDPWSDYPNLRDGQGKLLGTRARLLALAERWALRSAAAVTCTAPSLGALLAQRTRPGVGAHTIMNGFDRVPELPPAETGHFLRILFAGEIYMNRDPFPFLEAVERLVTRADVDATRVLVKFVGSCEAYYGRSLREWLQDKAARQVVEIHPPVPGSQVPALIAEATVLMNLAQNSPLQIPAKTFEHLVSGRELLVICEANCDTARLLDTVPGALRVDPNDAAGLDAALFDLYRRHVVEGRLNAPDRAYTARFGRDVRNAEFMTLLEKVAPQLAASGAEQRA
jgi:glycosyltransferase involved in cell wall biosynthesis